MDWNVRSREDHYELLHYFTAVSPEKCLMLFTSNPILDFIHR